MSFTVKIDPNATSIQASVIPDATPRNDGVMTKEQAAQLAELAGGTSTSDDYIIVGLGTAGAVLARYLSNDMTTSVLVLEAGQDRGSDPNVTDGNFFGTDMTGDARYSFVRGSDPADILAGEAGTFGYSDGRLWGGGSSHNGMSAVRSSPDVYDEWALVDPQWSYNNLLPLMKALETYTPNGTVPDLSQRGTSGPLNISQECPPLADPSNPNWDALMTAIASATNAPNLSDCNDGAAGVVATVVSQGYKTPVAGGFKRSTSQTAFLPSTVLTTDASGNGVGVGGRKLAVKSRAIVTNVSIKLRSGIPTATGVEYFLEGDPHKVYTAKAKKKVILCAGTIANAQLLQLSGIGPSDLLSGLNIPVFVDNPNVGANMQNHYGINGMIPLGPNSPPYLDPVGFQLAQCFCDLSGKVGPSLYDTGQASDGVRRCQIYFGPTSSFLPRALVTALIDPNTTPVIGLISFLYIPNRLGTVQIVSRDPMTPPNIAFHFYQDTTPPTDLDRAVQQFKVIWNISQIYAGAPPIYPPASHYTLGGAPNDDQLKDDAKATTLVAAFHASGSCRMATRIATGVVDGNLDVFGVANLACCDCSVQPTITKGNTAYPAFILAMKKAQIEGAIVP